ncbi:DUF397 domain-containing protein [Lipingzhangella sp. LS1_29]|uniref:DUF397 domain-containing protein n=1 Tax=Lipingzhangella rawalii TaxID=2055835 RepID=A0ABU2H7E6_9ACTN|nr:DUF397 domain-containing protein [Lipingzhangella rawalii]MDS1270759.1 DUF397 domain-containing protein [Lipingzhangella rawalii]
MNWRKSSYSGNVNQNCVEIVEAACGVNIRDSQHPYQGHLSFPVTEWRALVTEVKTGRW